MNIVNPLMQGIEVEKPLLINPLSQKGEIYKGGTWIYLSIPLTETIILSFSPQLVVCCHYITKLSYNCDCFLY